eukprot:7422406-Pyramimonas_sp.AAC.1
MLCVAAVPLAVLGTGGALRRHLRTVVEFVVETRNSHPTRCGSHPTTSNSHPERGNSHPERGNLRLDGDVPPPPP